MSKPEEAATSSHSHPDQAEAAVESFDEGRPANIKDDSPSLSPEQLAGAVQGPGGDSRPDPVNPEGAGFESVAEDPRMTTMRTDEEMPEVSRGEIPPSQIGDEKIVARPIDEDRDGAFLQPRSEAEKEKGTDS